MAVDVNARRVARQALLQVFVQALVNDSGPHEMKKWLEDEGLMDDADVTYFNECMQGINRSLNDLDRVFEPFLDRSLDELGFVECTALRVGTYELLEREDVPYRVVINEWVELAKSFGAEGSFRYINGVLDKVALSIRES